MFLEADLIALVVDLSGFDGGIDAVVAAVDHGFGEGAMQEAFQCLQDSLLIDQFQPPAYYAAVAVDEDIAGSVVLVHVDGFRLEVKDVAAVDAVDMTFLGEKLGDGQQII